MLTSGNPECSGIIEKRRGLTSTEGKGNVATWSRRAKVASPQAVRSPAEPRIRRCFSTARNSKEKRVEKHFEEGASGERKEDSEDQNAGDRLFNAVTWKGLYYLRGSKKPVKRNSKDGGQKLTQLKGLSITARRKK